MGAGGVAGGGTELAAGAGCGGFSFNAPREGKDWRPPFRDAGGKTGFFPFAAAAFAAAALAAAAFAAADCEAGFFGGAAATTPAVSPTSVAREMGKGSREGEDIRLDDDSTTWNRALLRYHTAPVPGP